MKCPKCGTEYTGTACPQCGYLTPPPPVMAEGRQQNTVVLVILGVVGGLLALVTMVALVFGMTHHTKKQSPELERSSFSKPDSIPDAPAEYVETTQADPEADKAAKQQWQQSKGIYESGDYAVGEDIPAGTYIILSNGVGYGDFYCGVYAAPSMSSDSEIWGDWSQNSLYIILEEGQYLHFSHSTLYDPEKSEIVLNPYQSSGMFQVGRDVDAGTYTLVGTYDQSGGMYTVYSALTSSGGVVRDSDYFEYGEEVEVTLYEGEYIAMTHCQFKAEE